MKNLTKALDRGKDADIPLQRQTEKHAFMAAEFYITFNTSNWYTSNISSIEEVIRALPTYSEGGTASEFWLTGIEFRPAEAWAFDVRLFMNPETLFLEISSHPPTVENDLKNLFSWLRNHTRISINDEDGLPSGW
jgi:hypothetical protein